MKILFVHFGDDLMAGSEIALLEMLRHLPRAEVEPVLWCNGHAMQQAAEAIGIPVFPDDFTFYFDYASPPFSPRAYLGLVRKGSRLISQCDADLVHCNSGAPAQWMLPSAGPDCLALCHPWQDTDDGISSPAPFPLSGKAGP